MISISAPIFPNESLGEITLRDTEATLVDNLTAAGILFQVSYEKNNDSRVSLYSIFEGVIIIAVDNNNSKIFRITAKTGYDGKLLDKIKIGDTLHDIYKAEKGFYYDEREDTILNNILPGVSLDLEVTDYLLSGIDNPKIACISVFAEESMTIQGQKGNW